MLNNPVIGALKSDLSRNEARLQELNSKFGDNHPQVQEAKANIAELRSRIDAETRKVTGGVGVTNTINKQREAQVRRELDAQRAKLLQLKQGILSNAGETTEHLRADTVIVPDPADRATIEEEHALELRTRDRERKLLKKIAQSLARIDTGEYGYCDETGEPIGLARLIARPTATLSLEAQQRRELRQKLYGD